MEQHRDALTAKGICDSKTLVEDTKAWCSEKEGGSASRSEQQQHMYMYSEAPSTLMTTSSNANVTEQEQEPPIMLLFTQLRQNPPLQQMARSSAFGSYGYMGKVSHGYSVWHEMADAWDTTRKLLQTELGVKGRYVRSRGESTLSASTSWLAYLPCVDRVGARDLERVRRLGHVQQQQLHHVAAASPSGDNVLRAGVRRPQEAPGAWAVLRDCLDVRDTRRFPEDEYGPVGKGNKEPPAERWLAIVAAVTKQQPAWPPRLDLGPTCKARKNVTALNDAGVGVFPSNYNMFMEQLDADNSSVGA